MSAEDKLKEIASKIKARPSYDDYARGWTLDYIEMSEARASRLFVELAAARDDARDARDRQREIVEAELARRAAELQAQIVALEARGAELEAELDAARRGPAARQPWHVLEGSTPLRARAALQDAIYHVQRDGEMGLARIYARHAAELIEGLGPRVLRLGGAAELDRVDLRLAEIIGQLDAAIEQVGARFSEAEKRHLAEIQEAARRALAELRGEDWR